MLLCACQIKLLFNRNVELEVLMEPRSQHRRAASQRAAEKGPCTQCACNLAAVSQSERQPPAQPNVGVKVKFLFHWMPADRGWMPLSSPLSPTHFQQCSSPIVGVAAWQVSKPALLWSSVETCYGLCHSLALPHCVMVLSCPKNYSEMKTPFLRNVPAKSTSLPAAHTRRKPKDFTHAGIFWWEKKSWWKVTFWPNSPADFHSTDKCLTH